MCLVPYTCILFDQADQGLGALGLALSTMHQSFVSHGAGDSCDIAGLKCPVLASSLSPQCHRTVGLLIFMPKQTRVILHLPAGI